MKHHAFLIYTQTVSLEAVPEEFRQQSIDVSHLVVDKLGIDEARDLAVRSSQTAVNGQGRVFIILASNITVQAQNALLKLFEEPPTGVTFYLVISRGVSLIPTLLSRLQTKNTDQSPAEKNESFVAFKAASQADRLALVVDKVKAKDQAWMEEIFYGALEWAAVSKDLQLKKSLLLANQYATSSGASKKMLLEEIALTL